MKSWKKRWKDELGNITPEMSERVRSEPLPEKPSGTVQKDGSVAVSRAAKISVIAVISFVLCAVIVGLIVFLPSNGSGNSLFVVEINPSATFCADSNGNVTGVVAGNTDADVVLSSPGLKEKIIGKNVNDAVKAFADCAAQLGFINFDKNDSAIRVSMLGSDTELLNGVQSSLKNYFISKGAFAAVLAENVNLDEFTARSGIQSNRDADSIVQYVTEQPTLYSVRAAQNKEIADVQKFYGEVIAKDSMFDLFRDGVKDNVETIKQNVKDILDLFSLQRDIYTHADNPAVLLKDYWNVVKYYSEEDFSDEFGEMINNMANALDAYGKKYGLKITSVAQLAQLAEDYSKLSVETLLTIADNFTKDNFLEYYDALKDILQAVGVLPDSVNDLMETPLTLDEYYTKTESLLTETLNRKLKDFKEVYGKERKPLAPNDFSSFEEEIVSHYGSLSAYWDSVKNK